MQLKRFLEASLAVRGGKPPPPYDLLATLVRTGLDDETTAVNSPTTRSNVPVNDRNMPLAHLTCYGIPV